MPASPPRVASPPLTPAVVLYATAFLEGFAVLLVEIIGARALAPYFGTSLMVWTAQITATLLFLALGYRAGGFLSARPSRWHLPGLFGLAGAWLLLFRGLRPLLMTSAVSSLSVATGSFVCATALFGVPLLCLGAVSPVVISYLDRRRPGAGSAAGALFFTNTLGGLAGGWATAFVVIPHLAVSTALAATGALLWSLGALWVWRARVAVLLVLVGVSGAWASQSLQIESEAGGGWTSVLYDRESTVGRVEVVDYPQRRRGLLIDGVHQNLIDRDSGASLVRFPRSLDALSHRYYPQAHDALILGLGAGSLARSLSQRGVSVTGVELDPRIVEAAQTFFGLPPEVKVEISDGRPFLRRTGERFDLIFLDVFAGENAPWYLTTVEALREMQARLRDDGVLLINTVTRGDGQSLGLSRLEAAAVSVFPEVLVFLGDERKPQELTNATVVAGRHLVAEAKPSTDEMAEALDVLLRHPRPASARVEPGTDDWHDLDYVDIPLRAQWRRVVLAEMRAR